MRLIIFGANGYLGRTLTSYFASRGFQVTAVIRDASQTQDIPYVEWMIHDISISSLKLSDSNYFAAINCIGHVSQFGSWETYYLANVKSVHHIVDWCLNHEVALIQLSSATVYQQQIIGKTEDAQILPDPSFYYGYSKYLAELEIMNTLHKYCILRPSHILGSNAPGFFEQYLTAVKRFRVSIGSSQVKYSLTAVDDLVQAIEIILKGNNWRLTYNLASPQPISLGEILQKAKDKKILPNHIITLPFVLALVFAKLNSVLTNIGFPHLLSTQGVKMVNSDLWIDSEKLSQTMPNLRLTAASDIIEQWLENWHD